MDFSKLNIEFSNMQKTVSKYTEITLQINNKIKENLKVIGKYETKIKNTKNKIEKDMAHLYISILKNENDFFYELVKENESNEQSISTKTV